MTLEIANGELPSELRDIIRGGKSVAFIGSGPSSEYYGSWHELINKLCEACAVAGRFSEDSPPADLLEAAQQAQDANRPAYNRCLQAHFGRYVPAAPFLYDVLLSVEFKCYLTTNVDPLLARKAQTVKVPNSPRLHAYPALDRVHMGERSIHYLHGYIHDQSCEPAIVLTRNEFAHAYENNGTVANLLVPTLENDPIVFVGCRLREPVMERVFAICKRHQQDRLRRQVERGGPQGKPPTRLILLPFPVLRHKDGSSKRDRNQQAKDEEFYKNMDIETVWYPPSDSHSMLCKAFERFAELPSIPPLYGWEEEPNVL